MSQNKIFFIFSRKNFIPALVVLIVSIFICTFFLIIFYPDNIYYRYMSATISGIALGNIAAYEPAKSDTEKISFSYLLRIAVFSFLSVCFFIILAHIIIIILFFILHY